MDTSKLLQRYLREVARTQYACRCLPPFLGCFHPNDALVHFNFAIPDEDPERLGPGEIAALVRAFQGQDRIPRLEFVEEATPPLPKLLAECGFHQEDRYPILTCRPGDLTVPVHPPTLEIEDLDAKSAEITLRDQVRVSREVFDSGAGEPSRSEIAWMRSVLKSGRGYQARLAGALAGGSMSTSPLCDVAEIAEVAVREAFRRHGIGTALVARAAAGAFARGVSLVFLSAGDERTGHPFEAIGFQRSAHIQTWSLR